MSRQSFWSWFSSRNPRRPAGRKAWRPKPSFRPWLEALEDRVVPDSGGATGVLAAAGPSLVYGGAAPGGIGSGPLISNVKVNLIFVKDTNSGTLMPTALRTQVQQFFTKITTDGYIPNLLSQYHIPGFTPGNGSLGTVDVVNAAPTTTDLGFAAYDDANPLASGQTP
jgi:hypothetical protein